MNNSKTEEELNMVPMMVLQDMVIMPGTSVHFDIQRKASIEAVNAAMEQNQEMFVVTSKASHVSGKVSTEQLCQIGTMVTVRQVLKLQKDMIRVLFVGKERAFLNNVVLQDEYYRADVLKIISNIEELDKEQQEARIRTIRDILKQCEKSRIIANPVTVSALNKVKDLELLIDLTAEAVPVPTHLKQQILETIDNKGIS